MNVSWYKTAYTNIKRRQKGDLILTFKILKNYLNIELSNFFTQSPIILIQEVMT